MAGDVLTDLFRSKRIAPFSNIMVRTPVIDTTGTLDERFPSLQDREWHFRLAQHCEFQPVREPLVVHRVTDADRVSDDFERKRDVSSPLFLEKHRSLAAEYGSYYERRFVASLSKTAGAATLSNESYIDAVSFLTWPLIQYPFVVHTWLYLLLSAGGRVTHRPALYPVPKFNNVVQNARLSGADR